MANDLPPPRRDGRTYVTAFAALGGAALGGFTSFASSWTTLRAQEIAGSKSRRQKLYKKFIDEAATHYD